MEKENKILIFRTSITQRRDIKRIGELLAEFPQIDKWNVDFEDWENIYSMIAGRMLEALSPNSSPLKS